MAAKYAILLNADDQSIGPAANAIEYALDLDDRDVDVELYFDGEATRWIPKLEDDPDHPVHKYYAEARERGLLAGACGYCANAFGAYDGVEASDVPLLGGREEHGPHVGDLVVDGYELLTVG